MADVTLNERLLADLGGWEAIKQARAILAEKRVLSSSWQPPVLRGVVQSGSTSYRAGLVIRRANDAENLCTCRQSREWGTLCPHSLAVGLHVLTPTPTPATQPTPPSTAASVSPPTRPGLSSSSSPTASPHPPRPGAQRLRRADSPDSGTPLTIHVVLPPNLTDGIARGRATVFLEGASRRGRGPLGSLATKESFTLGPDDLRLLDALEALADGETPSMIQLSAEDFGRLLPHLVDHPRITLGRNRPIAVRREPWRIPLRATLEGTGEIVLQQRPIARPPVVIPGDPLWVIQEDSVVPVHLPRACLPVLSAPQRLTRAQVPAWVSTLLPLLQSTADLEANFTAADFTVVPQKPVFHLHLAGGLASLTAHLQAAYGHRVLTLGHQPNAPDADFWMPDPTDPRRYATRDPVAEQASLQRLIRNGFQGPDAQGRWQLHGQNQVLTFFAREYPALEREWKVTLEERLEQSTHKNLERIQPQFTVTPSGEQWFDLAVQFQTQSGASLPTQEILRLVRGGQNHTRLKNGKIALIDTGAVEELEEILVDTAPRQQDGAYRIAQAQAGFVQATLSQQGFETIAPASWRERALQQTGEITWTCPPLDDLESVLRPYQKHGVAWLHFLRRNGFGGILADEMGLGKTLQTLALLSTLRPPDTSSAPTPTSNPRPTDPLAPSSALGRNPTAGAPDRLPSLVVCPTSLVYNWAAEAARFAPRLQVLVLHGGHRHADFARIPASDLVITSYALIRRDLARYRAHTFDTVILDEAQHIKNRQTANAQAVKAVPSRHRLVLTGTPLENSVLDLWSIFDFLMPGYLGSAQDFKERYEMPIVREKSQPTQARLARRIRPFLLRRLKRDVAPELPPRIDQTLWCDLTPEQAGVYTQLLETTRREVTEAVGSQGLARSRVLVFTALLRLRQVCCDLRLLGLPDEQAPAPDDASSPSPIPAQPPAPTPGCTSVALASSSAKLEAFAELLEEALDGGHRVLVFSQFTRMLALLRTQLDEQDIPYTYLDGATRDRAGVVSRFQENPDIPVFLISLKAGGVGLNLTAADTVVHFDPWWNPAVEDQATDRAHRIGQQRIVTSYKLITRGTVEEKILRLQQRKREIITGLLSTEETFSNALNWDEIQELLS